MLFCGRHSCTLCGPPRPAWPIQSPDRLLAGRRAREPANSWRTEEDGAKAEGRGRGQAGKKKKKEKKKQLHAVSVFKCYFLFSLGFHDLVIHFSSAGQCVFSVDLSVRACGFCRRVSAVKWRAVEVCSITVRETCGRISSCC